MIEQAKALLDSLAITFDFPILEFIRNYLTCDALDKAMPYITLFGEWGAFWIAIAVILLCFRKTRKTAWSMGAALMLGLIIVITLSLGLTTPPYGLCLLIASSIADLSVERSFKGVLPYFLVSLAVLAILILFPNVFIDIPAFLFPSVF